MSPFTPPYPPYDPIDTDGFSYETVSKRWPVILTKLIDHIHRTNHELTVAGMQGGNDVEKNWEERVEEGKVIIGKVSKLKYEMARDRELQPVEEDEEADVDTYNLELTKLAEKGMNAWFKAPWLYAECYLYRTLRSWFSITTHWRYYDPFLAGKEDSFKASSAAIYKLAATMHELEETGAGLEKDPEKLAVLFNEMIQMCLWGNATDLSLLTNLTHEDILKLQSVGKDAQEERKEYILHDDEKNAFQYLTTLRNARVDLVLDNAGFELFTDLVFADFLVTFTPYVSKVVFHPKSIPWFVSDVTPPDFIALFSSLKSETFFLEDAPSESSRSQLSILLQRWEKYIAIGAFELSIPMETKLGEKNAMIDFWTSPYPYWDMSEKAPVLFESLKKSGLVILKGDLNYRKLTGDVKWPASTPVSEAIGPLSGAFPTLSLRTSKADVVVGVDQAKADALDASGEKWRVNGKYAMISFVPKEGA
ncbi:DUF89 domain-containing protein [Fomitiporia mediterranea MF3/22]|uniref:DUF89 domain-containing protein n=1 Tax=Fomitiporia mediterranea (strain MF3/22) TaxID=694068 RepID=UPI0004409183|nr:DUF89 domain-containing protein [Fomitiporia mediterranea MF3/22]EJD04787.1 DUF89 domain-containing protein [Fomitiporia mediterranea MF3/22]